MRFCPIIFFLVFISLFIESVRKMSSTCAVICAQVDLRALPLRLCD